MRQADSIVSTGYAARTLLATMALASLLVGCPTPQIAQPDDFSDDPARLIAAVERRAAAVRSLAGELAVEVWQGDQRVRLKQLIAVDGQGRVRIDALSPFGQPISTLVSDGSRLMIYNLEDRTFRIGAATAENFSRLLPIRIEPAALSALLRGSVPVMAHTESTVTWNGTDGAYRLDLAQGQSRQRIEFEPDALRVVRLRAAVGERVTYTARLGDYSGTGDAVIPRRMRFEVPDEGLRVDIEVVDHTLDPPLSPEAFTLEAPRGIPVQAL